MPTPAFVLASASPARRRLLVGAGIDPIVCPSQFDEDSIQIDDPAELVKALAFHKADQVAQRLLAAPSDLGLETSQALVLGCDSLLWVNGHIYGKPESPAEAIARWRVMAGQIGELYTGHALIDPMQRKGIVRERMTRVTFAAIGDRQIEAYVSTGEPLQCAGCFALEGRGGQFIEEISGCHSNVIGLSLPLLRHMMNDLGYDITDFWQS